MKKIAKIMAVFIIFFPGIVCAKEISCLPRTEMGETITGGHLYERDDDLKISNLSRIDFDKLTITSAEGRTSKIVMVEQNVYKTAAAGIPYYFLTNDKRTIVTELSVKKSAAYIKVLLCK